MFVLMPIVRSLISAMRHRRDHDFGAGLFDRADQCIGIEGLVRNDCLGLDALDELMRPGQIVGLTRGERPSRQIPQSLDEAVNLGAQSPARAPDRLVAVFFGAPAACWWALTMVESRKTSSKSASLANSANTRCQIPRSDQRAKRLYTLFHAPKLAGKSRHGEPVRATHNTASTNKRLSLAVTPTSEAFPESMASMRAYWSSRRIFRGIAPTPSMSWNDSLNSIVNRP
jgi:hypothetical protein